MRNEASLVYNEGEIPPMGLSETPNEENGAEIPMTLRQHLKTLMYVHFRSLNFCNIWTMINA